MNSSSERVNLGLNFFSSSTVDTVCPVHTHKIVHKFRTNSLRNMRWLVIYSKLNNTHTYTHTKRHMYTLTHIHTWTCTHTHMRTHVQTHTHATVHTPTCIHTDSHSHTHAHNRAHAHMRAHINACTCTHLCSHEQGKRDSVLVKWRSSGG